LLSLFKNEMPKIWLLVYYFSTVLCIFGLLACLVLHFCDIGWVVGDIIARVIFYFVISIMFIIVVLFYSPKMGKLNYARWIKKDEDKNQKERNKNERRAINKRQFNKIFVRTVALLLSFLTFFFCAPSAASAKVTVGIIKRRS